MRILNFVQEPGGDTSLAQVKVTKDANIDVVVLRASDAGAKMSAEDKNIQVNGPATVTIVNTDAKRAFITFRIVPE